MNSYMETVKNSFVAKFSLEYQKMFNQNVKLKKKRNELSIEVKHWEIESHALPRMCWTEALDRRKASDIT